MGCSLMAMAWRSYRWQFFGVWALSLEAEEDSCVMEILEWSLHVEDTLRLRPNPVLLNQRSQIARSRAFQVPTADHDTDKPFRG